MLVCVCVCVCVCVFPSLLLEGGFSMGGAMALHLACRYHPEVAGVFALSSFLNKDSVAYKVQSRVPIWHRILVQEAGKGKDPRHLGMVATS